MENEAVLTGDEQLHRTHVERSARELQRLIAESEDVLAEVISFYLPSPPPPFEQSFSSQSATNT